MSTDFIPGNDVAFDIWFNNFIRYVELKTTGNSPQWKHIPKDRFTWLKAAYEKWYAAYTPCLKPHTTVETRTKNTTRKEKEKVVYRF